MSDYYRNTLKLSGPGPDRDRFVAEVADVPTHNFFGAHAPLAPGEDPTARWGTFGLYEWLLLVHDHRQTTYSLETPHPPDRWFELVTAQFPWLDWEMHTSVGLSGRTVRAMDGEVVSQ